MLKRCRLVIAQFLVALVALTAFAQRPRSTAGDTNQSAPETTPAPAPQTVNAKYEGGVFGYRHKINGSLTFDDSNNRLVFRDDKQKEIFPIPYNSVTGAYADTHAVRPAAATVASNVPYFGIPAGFIRTKVRYLTLKYDDPDSHASGVASFKLENRDILNSVLNALAGKAGLIKRGEVFIKKKE